MGDSYHSFSYALNVKKKVKKKALYGLAWMSRLLQIIGLFCKRALSKRQYSAKETYDFKEPTNCSHPICQKAL